MNGILVGSRTGMIVYMIARDDADIIEEKRPEFEERLEKVFNAAGINYVSCWEQYWKII